jgi:hypothetical protein
MAINLSSYRSIQTNLFIKIVVPNYGTLTFSDYHKNFTIAGTVYDGLGELVALTNTTSSLRAAPEEITISISGIPAGNVSDILSSRIKGSAVNVYRGFFDVNTGNLISVSGNPAGKFQGVISNYEISDDLDMGDSTGTIVLNLTATSVVELLNNKVTGRRTNPADFPSEASMNRVSALAKSNFNFGAPLK